MELQVIDHDMLDEMRQVMGDDFSLLLTTFYRDGERRLALLHEAAASDDREALRSQAHSLKGSSGNLGAAQLQRACEKLEMWARGESSVTETLPELLAAVDSRYQEARDALQQCA